MSPRPRGGRPSFRVGPRGVSSRKSRDERSRSSLAQECPMTLSLQRLNACLIAVCMFLARTARADIMQPDGTLIPAVLDGYPCHSILANVGACLDDGEVA